MVGRRAAAEAAREDTVPAVDGGRTVVGPVPFEEFYEREERQLFGALCLITGSRHEAEDITQEAFVRVWERWDRVQGVENPSGYLYRTAMNVFRMRFRRAKIATRRVAYAITKTDDLDVFEARFDLDRGLAELTPRQRAAVVLTELLELPSAEAGTALGIKASTVRKLAQQGREALRAAIGGIDG
jgi:RNA polymerase sigma-70 factor, ECF subfamily